MSHKSPQPSYESLEDLLKQIDGANGEACRKIYADYKDLFTAAPGASNNHHTWRGGYTDHVTEAMNIGILLFDTLSAARPLPFTKSDVLLVIYLHDIEKPFRYSYSKDGTVIADPELATKAAKAAKRKQIIEEYGIRLTAQQIDAFKYVEGARDADYTPNTRDMGELASLCHSADVLSARLWYDRPLATGQDSWQGSGRVNPKN